MLASGHAEVDAGGFNAFVAHKISDNFSTRYTYDWNGNLLSLRRKNENGQLMHDIAYRYPDPTKNRLGSIAATGINSGTYQYDALGNLVRDNAEGLAVGWNAMGKVDSICRNGSLLSRFRYSPTGQRQVKMTGGDTIFYIHDATGNVMCVYRLRGDTLKAAERHLYGSKRLGMLEHQVWMTATKSGFYDTNTIGTRIYELTDHLGNVTTTLFDRKTLYLDHNDDLIYSKPFVSTYTDYYPFGYPISDRSYDFGGYRYFFNGQESDAEAYGQGGLHAFEYRMHDTRIGRFWSVDPLAGKFPWNSVYAFAENRVVDGRELEGLEVVFNTSEFGSAVGAGRFGWNYVKGKGNAKDKAGITYFKYRSSFKISEEESVAGIMIANKSFHTGIDYSSDYFRQSTSKDGITNVELYPFSGISADGRWPDTYAGISFGIGWGIAISTTKTEIDASFSITYEERMKLMDLVIEKGFTYNDSDPKLEVIDQYLYYVDTGHIFNLFKETKIKTDIKMVNIEGEQWESVQYQQTVNDTLSK